MKSEEDEFQTFESKIDQVVNILNLMNSDDVSNHKNAAKLADDFLKNRSNEKSLSVPDARKSMSVDEDEFIVKFVQDRSLINRSAFGNDSGNDGAANMSVEAFQQSVEHDAARRAQQRREREHVAQNLRCSGNQAYRNGKFEEAINLYSKAIDHVRTSAVLFNNRALAYIRLGLYKKAIIDTDFVIQKLDEKNLRAWLFRAKAYYALGEHRDYQKSINEAKKGNPKKIDLIESVVANIETEDHEDVEN